MPILTPSVLAKVEQNMRALSEDAYSNALSDIFWPKLMKELPSQSQKEHLFWLLQSGGLDYGVEGNVQFVDSAVQSMTTTPRFVTAPALKVLKSQLEDLGGAGLQVAGDWSRARGVEAALFPQVQLCKTMIANPVCYDGQTFFHATAHLVNPQDSSAGTFGNSFTAAHSIGALPLSADATGTANVGKALAYIRALPAPNGVTPRRLKPKYLVVPPALEVAARVATSAQLIASTDFRAVINSFDLEIIVAPELSTTYGGSNTTWYIFCEDAATQIGAFIYTNREPCTINFYGPMTDAELARTRTYEWTLSGRSTTDAGHPFLAWRCLAS